MVRITKLDRERLEVVGLWKNKVNGKGSKHRDSNFYVANKQHPSRSKTYHVVDDIIVMRRIERWDRAKVTKITEDQLNRLKTKGIVTEKSIQTYEEFNSKANCFIALNGDIYVADNEKINKALRD